MCRQWTAGILWVFPSKIRFLLCDQAHDAKWNRTLIEEQDAVAIIPGRGNTRAAHAFSQILNRLRRRVKCLFNKLKQFRNIAPRCELFAVNHFAMIELATIRIWLRASESRPLRHDLEFRGA